MQATHNDDLDPLDETPPLCFAVADEDAGKRLDVVLTGASEALGEALSRTRIKGLIEEGRVTLDGAPVLDANHKVKAGQEIGLSVPAAVDAEPHGEDLPLNVVFEDEHLIIIDKPAGLVVHPAPGHASGTLVNALIGHCGASLSGIGGVKRPGIVHRLDKDTSGLLVVAKTDAAHRGFSKLFADHGRTLPLTRSYRAFVWGRPERLFGTVDAPLGRHPTDRQRMAVVAADRGREAITHWRLDESFGPDPKTPVVSLITCQLETGRTHQIRVHMAHMRHPVLSDALYAKGFRGKANLLAPDARALLETLGRQALHAAVLGFEHPVTGEMLEFESQLPEDLTALLAALRQD
jgi:23S rRNA pseudouridine1911/1915/1917 synthase